MGVSGQYKVSVHEDINDDIHANNKTTADDHGTLEKAKKKKKKKKPSSSADEKVRLSALSHEEGD